MKYHFPGFEWNPQELNNRLHGNGVARFVLAAMTFASYTFQLQAADPPAKPHEFEYALNESGTLVDRQAIPLHLGKAVAEAEEKLVAETDSREDAALVYTVLSSDGKLLQAETEVHYVQGSGYGGYFPHRTMEDEPVVQPLRHGFAIELRVMARGYQTFTRKAMVRQNQIIVWDDVVLEPIAPGTGAIIKGQVILEGGASAADLGIHVDGDEVARTDSDGRFLIADSRSGKVRVSVCKQGYYPMYIEVEVKEKGGASCELNGFRIRRAKIRWAYQPDGSRSFLSAVQGGEETVESDMVHRIAFGNELKEVDKESDFLIYQKEDKMRIKNFDCRGTNGPGLIEIKDAAFDTVKEAPSLGYKCNELELRPGRVYVVRSYDGAHYGKIEVISTDLTALDDE